MAASILNDGNSFFTNVLKDDLFKKTGALTGSEGRISWGVVDPRRHVMTIWEKDQFNFINAAIDRNATLISNGPFYKYVGGTKKWATFWYGVDVFFTGIGLVNATPKQVARERQKLLKKYFTAHVAEGYVFGNSENIVWDDLSRPRAAYFGRLSGRTFADYTIGQGDAPRIPEVIGGLFRSVNNYAAVDQGVAAQVGTWGLAPILAAPEEKLILLRESGMDGALEEYEKVLKEGGEEITPIGEGADDTLTGLIVALFGGGSPAAFANILAQVLVKDAVRVDGNSSILLVQGSNVLRGAGMNGPKIAYNLNGYMFLPG